MKEIQKAAFEMKNNTNIVIGTIDAIENEIENLSIKIFPSIYLFKRGNNKKEDYIVYDDLYITSDRIINFINSNMYGISSSVILASLPICVTFIDRGCLIYFCAVG